MDDFRYADDEEDEKKKKGAGRGMETQLLEARTLVVADEVTDALYRQVTTMLTLLERKDPKGQITVFVNSPGGSADSGFAIYDLFRASPCPIVTIANGVVASSAVLIFLGGSTGKRVSFPNARFLLHQPSTATRGQASDIDIAAREIAKIRRRYNEIVADVTKQPVDKVSHDSDRDFWMSAQEALDYKLIDRVISTRGQIAELK